MGDKEESRKDRVGRQGSGLVAWRCEANAGIQMKDLSSSASH